MAGLAGLARYSSRNTQDARNYGLSIISYASRYLLNVVPAYFSGELACRGARGKAEGVLKGRRVGRRFLPSFFTVSFDTAAWGILFGLYTTTDVPKSGSCRNSASRKCDRRLSRAPNTLREINSRVIRDTSASRDHVRDSDEFFDTLTLHKSYCTRALLHGD